MPGGNPDGGLGTDVAAIRAAIDRAWSDAGVAVLVDLGGAETNSEMAIEMLPAARQRRVVVCNAPVVEGAVMAATEVLGRVPARGREANGRGTHGKLRSPPGRQRKTVDEASHDPFHRQRASRQRRRPSCATLGEADADRQAVRLRSSRSRSLRTGRGSMPRAR